jgi:type IV secretory pathway VirJ component
MNEWHRDKIILCGCSFGADIMPFVYRRLPEDLRSKVVMVQLLSASSSTDFEVHMSEMALQSTVKREFSVVDEAALMPLPVICTYGKNEADQPLAVLKNRNFHHILLDGDHRYTQKMIPDIISSID